MSNKFKDQIVKHQGRATTGYAIASVAMAKEFQKNILFSEYAFQINHMATSPAYPLCEPWEDKKYSYDWFNSSPQVPLYWYETEKDNFIVTNIYLPTLLY